MGLCPSMPAPKRLVQRHRFNCCINQILANEIWPCGMLASGANEPVRPTPTKQRLRALLLGPLFVHELHEAVALLKLNPIARHRRLPIFQLLGTIRVRLAHWMSLVRNQVDFYEYSMEMKRQITLACLATLYHEWEKEVRSHLEREIHRWGYRTAKEGQLWKAPVSDILDLLEKQGWGIRNRKWYELLDACRLIVNVYKHGKGSSFDDLKGGSQNC